VRSHFGFVLVLAVAVGCGSSSRSGGGGDGGAADGGAADGSSGTSCAAGEQYYVPGCGSGEDVTITAPLDRELVPLPEGSSYLGFIFARSNAPAAVEHFIIAVLPIDRVCSVSPLHAVAVRTGIDQVRTVTAQDHVTFRSAIKNILAIVA